MRKPSFRVFSPLSVWGAIIEAWEELIINRGRVILSLTGVAAAVWAMATVIALGGVISNVQKQTLAQWSGREGTVRISANFNPGDGGSSQSFSGEDSVPVISHGDVEPVEFAKPAAPRDENGQIVDPFGDAALYTVELFKSNYWSRERSVWDVRVQAPGMLDCVPRSAGECFHENPQVSGVDPGYFNIFSHSLKYGRFLTAEDANLLMNPVVVNETMWKALNRPDIRFYPRLRLQSNPNVSFTVVGVTAVKNEWDSPAIYMNYETFNFAMPEVFLEQAASRSLLLVAPPAEVNKAKDAVKATLQGQLGPKWEVTNNSDGFNGFGELDSVVTAILAAIGGVVIALGALGLLTVSIVTIRFRVREIGIRRAMGASAKRIFLSVFLESVVATTVAGFIGVILSILTIRVSPLLAYMQIPVDVKTLAYPLNAALLGVLIAAGVGALAGIIPATIAVRVKPIDAIRF